MADTQRRTKRIASAAAGADGSRPSAGTTIGVELERRRLAHRATRLQRVLEALRDRAVYRSSGDGQTPPPLRDAIADFTAQLNAVERRLASHGIAQRRSGR
jgi:hypothetical protein